MLNFAPPDPTFSSSHVEYEGSTIKLEDVVAQMSNTASVGISLPNELSSSDSIYPSKLTQSQSNYSHYNNSLAVNIQRKPFRRRRPLKTLNTRLNTSDPDSATQGDLPATLLTDPPVIVPEASVTASQGLELIRDTVSVAEHRPSKYALLTSPNESTSDTNSITSSVRCYKGDESITALQSEFIDTVPLLLHDVPFSDAAAPSPPSKSSNTHTLPSSAKSGQKISFANSFMTMFGDGSRPNTRPAPPTSLNNTNIAIPIKPTNNQFLYRSKSATQFSTSEGIHQHVQPSERAQSKNGPVPMPGQRVKWDSLAISAEFANINSGFLHNAITTSMHAMGVESRQELMTLQNIVDVQSKLITELMARIKILETRQHISAEKIAKMNKTVNVLNPELVLKIIRYQKELDGTLKTISKKQDILSEDSQRRINDLRELVADLPAILARLSTLEKEILASKDIVEKLKQEVLN